MILERTKGIRGDWAKRVGHPHSLGIELNIDVSDTNRENTSYQIRGIVDVPSPPHSDDERDLLARLLFEASNIPEKERRGFRLFSWVAMKGGKGISVHSCGPIPIITDKDIIGEVKKFIGPDIEEFDENDEVDHETHNVWVREYSRNQYCRFESREELHQRWQDIQVNTQVLKPSGKLGLTSEIIWYELGQHVIVELLLRGEPLSEKNHHPRVQLTQPFFDGELCRRAAQVVSNRGTTNDVIVKYGKREHIKDLYEKGTVYLNVASEYDKSTHNPAVKDDERTIVFRGGCSPANGTGKFLNKNTVLGEVGELTESGEAKFSTIFECPTLQEQEYVDLEVKMQTNYWMFCMADVLDQRLFADFEADSCVVIQRESFVNRLLWMAKLSLPNTKPAFGRVNYVDPLGAFPDSRKTRVDVSMPIHMTKVFRYAYQREARFVCTPRRFQEQLEPRTLQIGPISDIADFIVL